MSDLLGKLRKLNPFKVIVYNGDESRVVAVPQRRRRWPQVLEAIESSPWSRVVLQNKSGEDLGYVDGEAVPEEESVAVARSGGGATAEAIAIVELVLKGQRAAMEYRDKELTTLLRAQGEVVRELTSGMRALQEIYRAQVDAAMEVSAMQTEAAMGGGDMQKLLEAAPALIPVIPHLRSLFAQKPPVQ